MQSPELQPGESVLGQFEFRQPSYISSGSRPAIFIVTDRALFILRIKRFAVSDPWYFECIPKEEIRQIRVRPVRPYGGWVIALLMVLLGGYTSIAELLGYFHVAGFFAVDRPTFWPFVLLGAGVMLPFALRGRCKVIIDSIQHPFAWKTPVLFESKGRREVRERISAMVTALRAAGIEVLQSC